MKKKNRLTTVEDEKGLDEKEKIEIDLNIEKNKTH